jgi:hypothetical protein
MLHDKVIPRDYYLQKYLEISIQITLKIYILKTIFVIHIFEIQILNALFLNAYFGN